MTAREAELLLGGYAAGILTGQERSSLFAAAIDNQALFDALADEEALRALMADPRARAELLRAVTAESEDSGFEAQEHAAFLRARPAAPAAGVPLSQAPEPAPARESWWRKLLRPAPIAAFSAVAVAAVGLVVLLRPEKPVEFAHTAKVAEIKGAEGAGAGGARRDADSPAPAAPVSQGKPEPVARVVKSSEPESQPKLEAKLREAEADRIQSAVRDEEAAKVAKKATDSAPAANAAPPPAPATAAPIAATGQQLAVQSQTPSLSKSQSPSQSQASAAEERKAGLGRASTPAPAEPAAAPAAQRRFPGAVSGALSGVRARKEKAEAPAPIEVWVELGQTRTAQTAFKSGDSVRIVVEPRTSGRLHATIGHQRAFTIEVRSRQRYTIPSSGFLPSEAAEQQVEVVFEPPVGEPFRTTLRFSFR